MRILCALLALSLFLLGPSYGQAVTGSLVGVITDSSGAAIPNAKVTAIDTNTGISRTTNTSEAGNYNFSDLPPGTYTVSAEVTGFKRATRPNLDIVVNTTVRADLGLQPGQITETIEVTSEAPMLQTERADTG